MSWFGLGGSKKPEPTPVIEHSFDNTPAGSYSGGSDFGGSSSSSQGSLGGGFGGGGGMDDLQVCIKW